MELLAGPVAQLLPALQAVAGRLEGPSWAHAGQLAWSSIFASPDSPAAAWGTAAYAWIEAPGYVELALSPAHPALVDDVLAWIASVSDEPVRATVSEAEPWLVHGLVRNGFEVEEDVPFFAQLELGPSVPVENPAVPGYRFRSITRDQVDARAACHRAAWSDDSPSSVSTERYAQLMGTPPYRPELDWVAIDAAGVMVAGCIVWLDGGVALVEPVGCAPGHRGRGLAGAVTLAAVAAARELGASRAVVRPRGDDGYPGPLKVYRKLGFEPVSRTVTLVGPVPPRVEGGS